MLNNRLDIISIQDVEEAVNSKADVRFSRAEITFLLEVEFPYLNNCFCYLVCFVLVSDTRRYKWQFVYFSFVFAIYKRWAMTCI